MTLCAKLVVIHQMCSRMGQSLDYRALDPIKTEFSSPGYYYSSSSTIAALKWSDWSLLQVMEC
jgi:hypothetical protein